MKNLKIIALFGLAIISTQQFYAVEEVETNPAVVTSEVIAPVATEVAPVVTAPAVQLVTAPIVATEKIETKTQAPAQTDYLAESKVMLHKFSVVAFDAMKRAAHDVRTVVVSAVTAVKNMSEDAAQSVRHFIHEKTAPCTADKDENVAVQTYRRDNRLDNNQSATTWVPVYAYELINGESVPYIAYYEEAQPTSSDTSRR